MLVHAYRLCLTETDSPDKAIVEASHARLADWFIKASSLKDAGIFCGPAGSGDSIARELGRLIADAEIAGTLPPLIRLLETADTQRERMHALYVLCRRTQGWTLHQRRFFFAALTELEQTAFSGAGMAGRLQQIRDRATATLSDEERRQLGELAESSVTNPWTPESTSRPIVQRWTLPQLTSQLSLLSQVGNTSNGATLFREVQCIACHRMNGPGGTLGPDLSSVASRFTQRDILNSILSPSDVIAEKYRGTQIVTTAGKVFNGHIVIGGDYRSSHLRIVQNPLQPDVVTEIPKRDIEYHQASKVSLMPAGLLDTLTVHEILDLLAFLRSGTAYPDR